MPSSANIAAAALLLAACGTGHVGAASSSGLYGGYEDTGLASWYGEEAAGNRTASGARFDPAAITVAHRTLPLGSFVEITAIDTCRSIVALVNDRGPGRRDRIIDLSRGAAHLLGTDRRPVASVRVRAITPSAQDAMLLRSGHAAAPRETVALASSIDYPLHAAPMPVLDPYRSYVVQVASFSSEMRARALGQTLGADVVRSGDRWRVRLGPYKGAAAIQRARDAVAERGYGDAQILPQD